METSEVVVSRGGGCGRQEKIIATTRAVAKMVEARKQRLSRMWWWQRGGVVSGHVVATVWLEAPAFLLATVRLVKMAMVEAVRPSWFPFGPERVKLNLEFMSEI